MSKRHDAVFDAVLSGLPDEPKAKPKEKGGARFLKRSSALAERAAGEMEEKTLRWVDPEECRMWERHNRDYELLTPANCQDLIDGIKAQGRQEFPAIVRKIEGEAESYEVICGARRHYAVSWLRANNFPQFKYLIEVRDLTDEEAFRLADIENRDREDISDYERAIDYASAIELYYDGRQKRMAERLEVSEPWLSRYLALAKLPREIVAAFASKTDIKESHARVLKPLLAQPQSREAVLARAVELEELQLAGSKGQGEQIDASLVVKQLKEAGQPVKRSRKVEAFKALTSKVKMQEKGKSVRLEFGSDISRNDLLAAVDAYFGAR